MPRIPQYDKQQLPGVAKFPRIESGVNSSKFKREQYESLEQSVSGAVGATGAKAAPAFITGAEKMMEAAMLTTKFLGDVANERQKEIDTIELKKLQAQAETQFNRLIAEAGMNQDYNNVHDYVNNAWAEYAKKTMDGVRNPRIRQDAENYFQLKTITGQVDIEDVYLKKQIDYQQAEFYDTLGKLYESGDKLGIKDLVNSQRWMSETQKGKMIRDNLHNADYFAAQKDIGIQGNRWVYDKEKYPDLVPEDELKLRDYAESVQNRKWQENSSFITEEYLKGHKFSPAELKQMMDNNIVSPEIAVRWTNIYKNDYDRMMNEAERAANRAERAEAKAFRDALKRANPIQKELMLLQENFDTDPEVATAAFNEARIQIQDGNFTENDLIDMEANFLITDKGAFKRILKSDLDKYNKMRDTEQGKFLTQQLSALDVDIDKLNINGKRPENARNAKLIFKDILDERDIDPSDKDYRQQVVQARKDAIVQLLEENNKKLEADTFWGSPFYTLMEPTKFGIYVKGIESQIANVEEYSYKNKNAQANAAPVSADVPPLPSLESIFGFDENPLSEDVK